MTQAIRIIFAAIVRGLAAIGGAITAYGATVMFTTAGVEPPNAIVFAGLVICLAVAVVLWSESRSIAGLWPAILIAAVPYALYAWGDLALAECPQPHPPITPTYACAPIGTHAIAIAAPIVTLAGLVLFVRDVRDVRASGSNAWRVA